MNLHYHQNTPEHRIIQELSTELGLLWDTEKAYKILRSVLHTLRNCIDLEEAITILTHLPAPLKPIFIDGWKAENHSRKTLLNIDDFVNEVRLQSENIGQDIAETKSVIAKVFKTIKKFHSDPIENKNVFNEMNYSMDGEVIPLFI